MSDILRTALKGGGRILFLIDRWANGDFHLEVTEDWARMTSIRRGTVTAEQMAAAADPDGLIEETVGRLVAAHINSEVETGENPALLPCKVGNTVYQTDGIRIYESKIKRVIYDTGDFAFDESAIGRSVFLIRKEAEAALEEQDNA